MLLLLMMMMMMQKMTGGAPLLRITLDIKTFNICRKMVKALHCISILTYSTYFNPLSHTCSVLRTYHTGTSPGGLTGSSSHGVYIHTRLQRVRST